MELRQLRYFVTVAEELNFNRAAKRLLIAQPALSQQILHLEKELEVSLFNRSKRQIQLTAAGKTLLEDAKGLLTGAEMVVRTAQRAERGELGRVRVGFVPTASWLLPRIIRIYQERFPAVELIFEELLNNEQSQALYKDLIDIAIALGSHSEEGLTEQLMSSISSIIALPAEHRLAVQASPFVTWKDMADEPFIMVPRHTQPQFFDQFVTRCQSVGFSPSIKKKVAQIETILNLVAAGTGIAPVPAYLKEMVNWKGVVFKQLEEPTPNFEIFALWRSQDSSPVLKNFIKVIITT